MAHNVLREMLVKVGFQIDDNARRKQREAVENATKEVRGLDKASAEAQANEKKRLEERAAMMTAAARAVGLFAAAAAAAVVATATAKMVGDFDRLYYVSGRTGASVNNIKALGFAFSQVGSSADQAVSAIESFARVRRTSPGVDARLRSYGVDTKGDTADVLMNSIDAIQSRHPYYTGAQIAEEIGITEEQYQTFTKYNAELKRYRQEYAELQKAMGVNGNEAATASQSISRSMGSLRAVVDVLGDKMATALAPIIERVVTGLKNWIASNPEQIEKIMRGLGAAVEWVGNALLKLVQYIGSDENQKSAETFFSRLVTAANLLGTALKGIYDILTRIASSFRESMIGKLIAAINPGAPLDGVRNAVWGSLDGEGRSSGAGVEKPGIIRRGWNAVKRAFGGDPGDMSGGVTARGRGANMAGARESYEFWRSKGLSHEQAAGLVAMEEGESSFNPRARGDGGRAHGAFQHHPDRRAKILAATGIDMSNSTHKQQLEATYWEMTQGQERGFWDAIQRQKTPGAAAAAGVYKFERPADKAGEAARRGARANYWASVLGKGESDTRPIMLPKEYGFRSGSAPGAFNTEDYLRSRPMGATSNSVDNSRSATMNAPVTVNVQGAGDAQATGSAVGRAVSQANDLSLRNVQTALR